MAISSVLRSYCCQRSENPINVDWDVCGISIVLRESRVTLEKLQSLIPVSLDEYLSMGHYLCIEGETIRHFLR